MNELTKEWLQNVITRIESTRDEIPFGLDEDQNKMLTAFKIALASLEAEPVAWMCDDADGREYNARNEFSNGRRGMPLYAAPPVPVVPEEISTSRTMLPAMNDQLMMVGYVKGWNACRAAVLHGAEPVSQNDKLNELSGNSPVIPDGWISCSERMPDNNHNVLFFDVWGYIRIGWFSADDWLWFTSDDGCCMEVTHWMPLPEPPQEVK